MLSSKLNRVNDIDETLNVVDIIAQDDIIIKDTLTVPVITSKTSTINFSNCNLTGIQTINGASPAGTYNAGDLIKTSIFNIADYNFNTTSTGAGETTIWSFSFSPQNSSSYLLIDFTTCHDSTDNGERDDYWIAFLKVDGAEVGKTTQNTYGQQGNLTPIHGKYTNSSTSAKTIAFIAYRFNAVANQQFVAHNSFSSLVIREIKR